MSVSFSCHCEERKKPVKQRNWIVRHRRVHHSAFSGYRPTYTDYSLVQCLNCMATGRTKARYVSELKDKVW